MRKGSLLVLMAFGLLSLHLAYAELQFREPDTIQACNEQMDAFANEAWKKGESFFEYGTWFDNFKGDGFNGVQACNGKECTYTEINGGCNFVNFKRTGEIPVSGNITDHHSTVWTVMIRPVLDKQLELYNKKSPYDPNNNLNSQFRITCHYTSGSTVDAKDACRAANLE